MPELALLLEPINAIDAVAVKVGGTLRLAVAGGTSPALDVEIVAARSGALHVLAVDAERGFELASDGVMAWLRTEAGVVELAATELPDPGATSIARWLPTYALVDALLPAVFPAAAIGLETLVTREAHAGEWWVSWLESGPREWVTRRRAAVAVSTRTMVWFETFDRDGALRSKVEYHDWQDADGSLYPGRLTLRHGSGVMLELSIDSWKPLARTEPDAFRLRR